MDFKTATNVAVRARLRLKAAGLTNYTSCPEGDIGWRVNVDFVEPPDEFSVFVSCWCKGTVRQGAIERACVVFSDGCRATLADHFNLHPSGWPAEFSITPKAVS